MNHLKKYFWLIFSAALIVSFAGCATTSNSGKSAFASPEQLTATFTNGDIALHWKNYAAANGGNWIEFATPGSEYVKLQVFMSDANVTSFVHPRVATETTFIYRVSPFFGQPTAPVEIATGTTSSNDVASLEEGPIVSTNEISSVEKISKYSIHSLQTFADATPSDLTATLSSPTSVDLHWKDRASDEDGYLLEIASSANGKFFVCALLPADTTSFRKTGLPQETKCYFRVRAFFYGKPSNLATMTTPAK